MNIRKVLTLGVVVLAVVLFLRISPGDAVLAEPQEVGAEAPAKKASSALVGRMGGVTMLEFQTDRALQEIRVVVNEKIAGSKKFAVADNKTKLRLAAVVSEQRKSVSVFIDAENSSTEIIAAYPPIRDARDMSPKESIGPVKDVKLAESGWIEVYRLSASRYEGKDLATFELKVEIR